MTKFSFVAPAAARPVDRGPVPSFSVIVAAYQAASVIGDAIESALDQTLPPLEVIVCDDGSTDDLEGALAPYRERIVVVRQENAGGAAALNTAMRRSTGDFLSILDADDWYAPTRLQALAELAVVRPDLDILATDAHVVVDGNIVGSLYEATPFAVEDQRIELLDRCFILHPAVRRTRLEQMGGFDESLRITYDWDCWLRLVFGGAVAGLVDEPLHNYRISAESLSANRAANLRERVLMLERLRGALELDSDEQRALHRSLEKHRLRALLAEAEAALRAGLPGRRRSALRVTFGRGFLPATRLKAAVAAIAPSRAAERLQARERETGSSYVKRSIPGG